MVSVVVPAYNEEQALPHTLDALLRQEGAYEVILVDGGSSDRTCAIAESFGLRQLSSNPPRSSYLNYIERDDSRRMITAPKGRASQMNVGAKIARGEWLLFLHADT